MNPEIQKFLKQLLIDAGQTGLGEALENELIQDLYPRLEQRLILTAMLHLSPAKQREAEKMLEKAGAHGMVPSASNTKKLEEFFKKNIADYEKVFAEALVDFSDVYIQAVKGAD